MMNIKLSLLLIFSIALSAATAQELNFKVSVNSLKAQLVDPTVFEDLKQNMENFLNNQKWTDDVFEIEERIKCNIQLTIKEETSATSFKADMQIQAVRPIFGSSEETLLLSHNDKDVSFSYEQYQPLEFSKNAYNDNLTSILSFYVYYILGLDYDSFSPYGGEVFFQLAQDIVNTIPPNAAAANPGWRSLDSNRNRYWMIENILSPRVRPYRKAMYDYHRQSLDLMHQDADAGRLIMMGALREVEKVNKAYPSSMIIKMFANAKANEVVEIFKKGTSVEKSTVRGIMTKIDAANASNYRKIGS